MANYEAATRTNYFRVTDEAKYKELLKGLSGEDRILDFTEKDKDGNVLHGFGSYGSVFWYPPVPESECNACPYNNGCDVSIEECRFAQDPDIIAFYKEMQKILPEDEAFILFEAGNEKLRYVIGYVVVVTKKEIVEQTLEGWALQEARKRLGEQFLTKTTY